MTNTIRFFFILLSIIFLPLVQSCSQNNGSDSLSPVEEQANQVEAIFSDTVTRFAVHVVYEQGAEPRVGNISLSANNIWDITETSFESLFQQHTGRTVQVPKTLGEMEEIPDQDQSTWTAEQLKDLGRQYAAVFQADQEITMTVIFLNGLYDGQTGVLGVHFTGFPFSFVFKDVVVGVGGGEKTQQYVEQSTVVHELGHSVGLVDIGLPMVVDHEDIDHPGHTTNEDGVMYWAVESSDDVLSVLTDIIVGNQLDLFGNESKADAGAYHPE